MENVKILTSRLRKGNCANRTVKGRAKPWGAHHVLNAHVHRARNFTASQCAIYLFETSNAPTIRKLGWYVFSCFSYTLFHGGVLLLFD